MFTVKWVIRGQEVAPIESEAFRGGHADVIIASCRYRMEMMRRRHPEAPPDGFIVADADGKEIGRWIGPSALP
jgi:hypothetical protein